MRSYFLSLFATVLQLWKHSSDCTVSQDEIIKLVLKTSDLRSIPALAREMDKVGRGGQRGRSELMELLGTPSIST